jgi:hypothetical protein
MNSNFNNIDKLVIQTICEAHEEGVKLMNQYLNATILRREASPVGWFTYFQVDSECTRLSQPRRDLGSVNADVVGMEGGIGFMLWLEDGMLSCLEAYTYGENLHETIEIISMKNS